MNYTEKVIARAADRLKTIDGKTVVGFSGGADSTVLLTVLIKLLGADKLTAVHINHMLRGDDADSDENFCREFAQAHGVEFVCRRVDVRETAPLKKRRGTRATKYFPPKRKVRAQNI